MERDENGETSSLASAGSSRSSGGGQDVINVLLMAINNSQAEIRKLWDEVRAAQEEAAGRQVTKKERPYYVQKKGHKEQFAFNEVVADRLEEAESHLARAACTIAVCPAKDALEKA